MPRYREWLPQLSGDLFLTDGGLETTLIFHDGLELPSFAAFTALQSDVGRAALHRYFASYAAIARDRRVGVVLDSPTWRAGPAWIDRLGYSAIDLDELNHQAVALLEEVRVEFETEDTAVVISGCIGPPGDGYDPARRLSAVEAERYHATQVAVLSETAADLVSAMTLAYPEEAIGIARAAAAAGLPVVISFTVETDGRLPTGETLESAIDKVDEATDGTPAYYMINCAHPSHFVEALDMGSSWTERIRGIRANASTKSHVELDEAKELDAGEPEELAVQFKELRKRFPHINVLGGCCGTDHRHLAAIARVCAVGND